MVAGIGACLATAFVTFRDPSVAPTCHCQKVRLASMALVRCSTERRARRPCQSQVASHDYRAASLVKHALVVALAAVPAACCVVVAVAAVFVAVVEVVVALVVEEAAEAEAVVVEEAAVAVAVAAVAVADE